MEKLGISDGFALCIIIVGDCYRHKPVFLTCCISIDILAGQLIGL